MKKTNLQDGDHNRCLTFFVNGIHVCPSWYKQSSQLTWHLTQWHHQYWRWSVRQVLILWKWKPEILVEHLIAIIYKGINFLWTLGGSWEALPATLPHTGHLLHVAGLNFMCYCFGVSLKRHLQTNISKRFWSIFFSLTLAVVVLLLMVVWLSIWWKCISTWKTSTTKMVLNKPETMNKKTYPRLSFKNRVSGQIMKLQTTNI